MSMQRSDSALPMTLQRLNQAAQGDFVATLGGVVEHSPWVAEQVAELRPFDSVWSLHAAMFDRIRRATREQQLALMRLHPQLAGREASEGTLTDASNAEQARLGLLSLSRPDHQRLQQLNEAYSDRFGFPFITAVRLHKGIASIFDELERRLGHGADAELAENVRQIGEVLRGRLARLFGTPLGWLSTHVLDSVAGAPAAGMAFAISVRDGSTWERVGQGVTNDQGRTDRPVLVDAMMTRNVYQLEFQVGAYFRDRGVALAALPFLDQVPVRFGIDDPDLHYHVPLLCTPWTYSTYRGS
jgi:2-oxo-4-hydroxy-4-carboxy-5-ureidoimidazoline decarboxylase